MNPIRVFALLASLSAGVAGAQDRTLVGSDATHGWYGGPVARFSRIAGKDAVLSGGRGALVVNGTYALGGGGVGWSSKDVRGRDGLSHELEVGFGGIDLEYIGRTHSLVHYAVLLTLGGGGATQDPDAGDARYEDSYFVAEPGIGAELNITKGLRASLSMSYRLVRGVQLPAFSSADLSGAALGMMLRFGKFN